MDRKILDLRAASGKGVGFGAGLAIENTGTNCLLHKKYSVHGAGLRLTQLQGRLTQERSQKVPICFSFPESLVGGNLRLGGFFSF